MNKNAFDKYRGLGDLGGLGGLGGRNKAQKKTNDWKMV